MDRVILGYWKELLQKGDRLYFCGDLALHKRVVVLALDSIPKGVQVYFVFGNHDYRFRRIIDVHPRVVWSGDLREVKIDEQRIMLCHWAMRSWAASHHGSWQLHGHSHNMLHPWERQLDVGVDSAKALVGEYRPLTFEEVRRFILQGENPKVMAEKYGVSPSWMGGSQYESRSGVLDSEK